MTKENTLIEDAIAEVRKNPDKILGVNRIFYVHLYSFVTALTYLSKELSLHVVYNCIHKKMFTQTRYFTDI